MKKTVRSALSLLLSFAILLSFAVPTCAQDNRTIRNINETYRIVTETALSSVYEATLYADGQTAQDIYYVVCRGLDINADPEEPLSLVSAVRVGLSNENNSYVKTLAKIIKENVPAGSKLVLAGHSLGGMVIEQIAARKEIKKNYDILNVVTMGSPYILTSSTKEGTLRRMVDPLDPVPYLSIPFLANPYIGNACIENSYITPYTHTRSYGEGQCWTVYDALGKKNGSAYIEIKGKIYG